MQNMAGGNRKTTILQQMAKQIDGPGPGQYETERSDFKPSPITRQLSGIVINPTTVISSVSPSRANAARSNPALQKMSVPTIPSKFLTPILDTGDYDMGDVKDRQDICKMSRLVDDPTRVSPSSYYVNED